MSISEEEISSVIKKSHPFKAAGSDGIPFFILKCLGSPLVSFLKPLFQACINLSYHPTAFCHCNTVPLRKPGKEDYSAPGAWRPIALLNTLGKGLESVIAQQILSFSEEFNLLPAQHMGARPGRSIDTALDVLVQQIHATWQNKDGVATLLLLDMTGAFDRVVPARLLHYMRERKIPEWIVKWVGSFISNRTTTLCLPGYKTNAFPTHTGIPQGSPLSPILFRFYNANLVEICNPLALPASGTGFVDDLNALTFNKLTDENCKTLQTVHQLCLEWVRRHGPSFAPEKYILMHFTKARTKHNHSCPLILPTSTIYPSPSARVLGVILNKKLSWQPHLHHVKSKLAVQTNVHSRLTASTLGTSLRVSRLLYTAVVQPVITTGCPAWWAPPSTLFYRKGVGEELQRVENSCLKTVSRAYKATPVRSLQAEVGVYTLYLCTWMAGRPIFA
jgi:hypothetical protein